MTKNTVEFVRNGKKVTLTDIVPTDSLLDYLRLTEGSYGTKEGCGEGDCGACTVVLGRHVDGKMQYRPVNSCIYFIGMVDGQEVITVDDLADSNGELHPVQAAMVEKNAAQCGFCTPGFVMALFALYHDEDAVTREKVTDQLAGNLCRCTGYRPIVDAAIDACQNKVEDKFSKQMVANAKILSALQNDDLFIGNDQRFFAAPKSAKSLSDLYAKHTDATLVSGATDVGLWVTKKLMDLPKIIFIGDVAELNQIEDSATQLTIGAAVTYADAEIAINSIDDDIAETVRRIGSKQVRESGTIGGNIANGSPIGDMPPILIAMGAKIYLQKAMVTRDLMVEDFFIAYGKQDIESGEFLTKFTIPKLKNNEYFRCFKISKRFDQDISAVMAAFHFTIDDGVINSSRIAFGGMAATPKRALATEAALQGRVIADIGQSDKLFDKLAEDFSPLSDMRASAEYRLKVVRGLLFKALNEVASVANKVEQPNMRVIGKRGA